MIYGIGVDIIEINRVENAIERTTSFLGKVFNESEILYVKNKKNKYESLAGNFAAKEAFSKALGTGVRGFSLREIEITRDTLGKPGILLHGKAKEIVEKENLNIHLSISHSNTNAVAYVVLEKI